MLVLGMSGGPFPLHDNLGGLPPDRAHDAAACLFEDGHIAVAIEQERVDRIKHSNKAPLEAVVACLRARGVALTDVDVVAYNGDEAYLDSILHRAYLAQPELSDMPDMRDLVRRLLARATGVDLARDKIHFVRHHVAHAMSAYAFSGFDDALIVSLDGQGDDTSGLALDARDRRILRVCDIAVSNSVGNFYKRIMRFIGFGAFEEYKVMGLAPYGDRSRFESLFRTFCRLEEKGEFVFQPEAEVALLKVPGIPRARNATVERVHMDVAAALQQLLEEIVLHFLSYHRARSGLSRLCLAGGVAHNCTMNSRILASGLFEEVFVQPAAHDAGCAVGAAAYVSMRTPSSQRVVPLEHLYFGPELPAPDEIESLLSRWTDAISFRRVSTESLFEATADLLADGRVIGWVQGRSEFGPRALGNRSILADPRPAANKDRINEMIKKRESFRPFAPAVQEEHAAEIFELPPSARSFAFMIFVVSVRAEHRETLGAVTHVDGTARLQTVSRSTNARFWSLIDAFRRRTGVPVLLNTSFNNNAEPIVESVDDAVTCFLTTGLDALVVGDHLVTRRAGTMPRALTGFAPSIIEHGRLVMRRAEGDRTLFELRNNHDERFAAPISRAMFHLLSYADGQATTGQLFAEETSAEERSAIVDELYQLWSKRQVVLRPVTPSDCSSRTSSPAP